MKIIGPIRPIGPIGLIIGGRIEEIDYTFFGLVMQKG